MKIGNFFTTLTAQSIFEKIYEIRCKNLSNPIIIGNAGSFFLNPIINFEKATNLIELYPNLRYYLQSKSKIKN
ncbi:MAG: hypothetical protein V6009_00925 [Candidatus Dasytiphilus stammeri]